VRWKESLYSRQVSLPSTHGQGIGSVSAGSEVTRAWASVNQDASTRVNPTTAAAAQPTQAHEGEGPCFIKPRVLSLTEPAILQYNDNCSIILYHYATHLLAIE